MFNIPGANHGNLRDDFQTTKLLLMRWFSGMHLPSQSKNSIPVSELRRHLGMRYKDA